MRIRWISAAMSACLVLTSGCSVVRNDLRHPGGQAGRMLDRRTFDASQSKDIALLRAVLAIAIAARMGQGSVAQQDSDAFARQLAEAANEVNYAAADAGFTTGDEGLTCVIAAGARKPDDAVPGLSEDKAQAAAVMRTVSPDSPTCTGYYVNFESHLPRIESRIVRSMLTSLPTDKARKFLEKISSGDLLSALTSLVRSVGDVAGAFHRGAAVYRSGSEVMAATMGTCYNDASYGPREAIPYKQEWNTVFTAAQCLGLSREDLFDAKSAGADDFPIKVDPVAFHALFRIARIACLGLAYDGAQEPGKARSNRQDTCKLIRFEPKMQALDLDPEGASEPARAAGRDSVPAEPAPAAPAAGSAGGYEQSVPSVPPPPPPA